MLPNSTIYTEPAVWVSGNFSKRMKAKKFSRKFTSKDTQVEKKAILTVLHTLRWLARRDDEKIALTCVLIWSRPSERKSSKVNASEWKSCSNGDAGKRK